MKWYNVEKTKMLDLDAVNAFEYDLSQKTLTLAVEGSLLHYQVPASEEIYQLLIDMDIPPVTQYKKQLLTEVKSPVKKSSKKK